jgi:hypothetical protein
VGWRSFRWGAPRGEPHVDRGLLRALGVSGEALEGSSSGQFQLVSSLSERFGLSFSLVDLSKSFAVANLVIWLPSTITSQFTSPWSERWLNTRRLGMTTLRCAESSSNSLRKAQLGHRKRNLKRSSSRHIRRERRRTGRKKRGPRKSVNSGGNPGNWQMKGKWRLTLTKMRMRSTTAKAC